MVEDGNNNDEQQQKHEDDNVWTSFAQSVTYLKQVAAIYQQTFCSPAVAAAAGSESAPTPRKKTTKARLDEAKGQAQEALELLASNLLNAPTAIVSTLENQETAVVTLSKQLDTIKTHLQRARDDKARLRIQEFYALGRQNCPEKNPNHVMLATSQSATNRPISDTTSSHQHASLKLSLANSSAELYH